MADASLVFSILGVDKASDVLDKIGGKLSGLSKAAVVGFAAVTSGAVAGAAALYNVGATFDDMSDTIQVATGASGAALDGLVASAKNVGAQTPVELDKIAPALAAVNQRLGLTGPALETVTRQFLNLGNMLGQDVDIDAATGALNIFGIKGDQVSGALDSLFTITQKSGIGFNDLTGLLAKSGASVQALGLDFNTTAGLLGSLDKAGVDAGSVVTAMQKGLVTLAKAGEAPEQTFKNVVGQISQFTAAGNTAGAVDLASKLFGTKGAAQFVAAVQSGAVNVDALTGAVAAQGAGINATADDTADFAEAWQIFKNRALIAIEPVATRVFAAFGDGMKWFNEVGSPALQRFAATAQEKLQPAIEWLGNFITTQVVPAVIAFGNYVRDKVIPAVADFGGWLQKYQGWLIPIAAGIGAIVVALKVYQGVQLAITTATKIWAAAQAALNVVMAMNPIGLIVLAIVGLVAAFVVAYQRSETFRDIVNGVFNAVRDVVVSVITTVKDVIMGVWNWISDNWPLLLAIITGPIGLAVLVITTYWDNIKDAFTGVKDWIFGRVDDIAGFITGLPGRVAGAVSGMWESIKSGATGARDWVTDRLQDIINFIGGVPSAIASTAVGMFDGIWQAFKSAINNVIRAWNNLSLGFDGFTVHIPLAPDISVPGFHIGTPDIPMLAKGGIVTGPTIAVLGDNPSRKEAVIPLERAGQFGFGGGGATINITLDGRETEQLLTMNKLRKTIRDQQGRGPNSVQMALGT